MEPQEKGSRSYDVRINTAILRDPARHRAGPHAIVALIMLQAFALEADRDGVIYESEYTRGEGWAGITGVTDEAIAALKKNHLAEDYADELGNGIRVTWRWQSTVEERTNNRKNDAARQQARRDRQKEEREELERLREEKAQWGSRITQTVTGASRVTHGGVGEVRKGQDREGEREVRNVSRADQDPTRPPLAEETNWPAPPPKDPPPRI